VDSEPSRFIEEIDDQYLEIVTPKEERRFNPMLSADIFGDVDTNTVRYKKPAYMKKKTKTVEKFKISTPKNLKKVSETNSNSNVFDTKLIVGDVVNHQRFGKGNVLSIEGKAADLKAEIKFETGGVKKLLLRFAKLEIIS
jgi:DNA helicase-2/ATP-dependent DNA helicase PcrA